MNEKSYGSQTPQLMNDAESPARENSRLKIVKENAKYFSYTALAVAAFIEGVSYLSGSDDIKEFYNHDGVRTLVGFQLIVLSGIMAKNAVSSLDRVTDLIYNRHREKRRN